MSIDTQNKVQIFTKFEVGHFQTSEILEYLKPQKRVNEYALVLFAKMNEQWVGFASLGIYHKGYDLDQIKVVPTHRRKGVGTLLMLKVLRIAKAEGQEFFCLSTKKPLDLDEWWPEEQTLENFISKQEENDSSLQFFEEISTRHGIKIEKTNHREGRSDMIEIKYFLDMLKDA